MIALLTFPFRLVFWIVKSVLKLVLWVPLTILRVVWFVPRTMFRTLRAVGVAGLFAFAAGVGLGWLLGQRRPEAI